MDFAADGIGCPLIYLKNAIESLNRSLRKVTENRPAFPDDESASRIFGFISIPTI